MYVHVKSHGVSVVAVWRSPWGTQLGSLQTVNVSVHQHAETQPTIKGVTSLPIEPRWSTVVHVRALHPCVRKVCGWATALPKAPTQGMHTLGEGATPEAPMAL